MINECNRLQTHHNGVPLLLLLLLLLLRHQPPHYSTGWPACLPLGFALGGRLPPCTCACKLRGETDAVPSAKRKNDNE